MKPQTIKYKDQSVDCYGGHLQPDDNIIMAGCFGFEEDYQEVIENHNYNTDLPFMNWKEAVKYLVDLNRFGEIIEMEKG